MPLLRGLCRRARRAPAAGTIPPRRQPVLEPLEDRTQPSGLSFQFQVDDPGREFSPYPLLRKDLGAVGQILSGLLEGHGTVQVRVRPNDTIDRSDGSTVGVAPAGSVGGMAVTESAALGLAQTGVNPNGSGPEVELEFNARDYLPHAWFDPSGAARTGSVPADRADFISVALHEMLHALGFQGYRTISGPGYGTLAGGTESSFDALTSFTNGLLYFRGPLATWVYGGPVPLTSVGPANPLSTQNFYHLGNPPGRPGADLSGDIMNGMMFAYGTRYTPSKVDLAVLADLGWAVHGFPTPPAAITFLPPAPSGVATPPPANLPSTRQPAERQGHHHVHHAHHPRRRQAQFRQHPRRPAANPFAALQLFL
jgi:hypothetical protein